MAFRSRRTAMSRKRHKPEEIVAKLRQVDVLTSQGTPMADAIRSIGVTEVTYYRWRNEYGGLKSDQVKRLKDLETENARLHKAIWASNPGTASILLYRRSGAGISSKKTETCAHRARAPMTSASCPLTLPGTAADCPKPNGRPWWKGWSAHRNPECHDFELNGALDASSGCTQTSHADRTRESVRSALTSWQIGHI